MAFTLLKLVRKTLKSKPYDVELGRLVNRMNVSQDEEVEPQRAETTGPCDCNGCQYRRIMDVYHPDDLRGENLLRSINSKAKEIMAVLNVTASITSFINDEGKIYFHIHRKGKTWGSVQVYFMEDFLNHIGRVLDRVNAMEDKGFRNLC